ncbi:MAG: hypothetical protein HY314_10335 [Acidobacteria bacterium]|nr:hypothetical protein [Acidobacteriota bacterium]
MKKIIFAILLTLISSLTWLVRAQDEDVAYLICAKDGVENKVSRALLDRVGAGGELPNCTRGHRLDEVLCPKDRVRNRLIDDTGARREQCAKDGASLIMLPQDRGLDRVAPEKLGAFPAEMQQRYQLFSQKCSKCHTLARPLNAKFHGLEWQKYVKRMMRRPGSEIAEAEGREIYQFLKFYSENR